MKDVAYLGGGCFWCTEEIFKRLNGVLSVTSGYSGGTSDKPTYEKVSRGDTKYAEVIEIEFDPKLISYKSLLDIFFSIHDPTTSNQQGSDKGTQYRSIVLYTSEFQRYTADKKIKSLDRSRVYTNPVVTELVKFERFFKAENYHQNFYASNQNAPYCKLVILPKIDKLHRLFPDQLKR